MTIHPKRGIGPLLFGMKQLDAVSIFGKPDKQFDDEDGNVIYVYNANQLRLTFYEDESFRLGYMMSSNPNLTLFDQNVIGRDVLEIKAVLLPKGFKSWEQEDFDLAENHFNDPHWLILQTEFGKISKIEVGAIINDKDEFEWQFKGS